MNATDYLVDRRDIRFVQKEFLKVQSVTHFSHFSHFSESDIDLFLEEGANVTENILSPINQSGDNEGCQLINQQVITPKGFKEAWGKLAEGGWLGTTADINYGGQGLPLSISIGVLEGFYGSNPALYNSLMLTSGSAGLIVRFGTETQKTTYATKMLSGQWAGTMCLSEPEAGSAVGDITAKATKRADGHYDIKGLKCWITGGDHDWTENIVHLVLARIEGAPLGPKGISLFIVPRQRLTTDGTLQSNDITTVRLEHKLGIKASPTCVLEFGTNDDCIGELLEGEHQGLRQMFTLMNEARYVVAYQGLGASAGAYQNALAYAKERKQGIAIEDGKDQSSPRTPIVSHPDVRQMLMNMKSTTEGLRALIYALGMYIDYAHYGPEGERAKYQDLVDILIPVAKNAGADQGFEAIRQGIQVLGGVGFTEEFPLAQALRDTKIASIYEGTTGIQALDLITRKLPIDNGRLLTGLMEMLDGLAPKQANMPALQQAIHAWQEAKASMPLLAESIRSLKAEMGSKEWVFNATEICTYFQDVVIGYYLLKMALVAEEKLHQLGGNNGHSSNNGTNGAALDALLDSSEEACFYFNKIKTAEHHTFQILPRTLAISAKVQSRNFAALEARL